MAFDPISAIFNVGEKLIDRLWPDPTERDKAKFELFKLQQSGELAQISAQMEVNKAEAGSTSMFVAGWRPFVGWICGVGLGYQFVVQPIGTFIAAMAGKPVVMPSLDLGTLLTLLFGMLGLGAYRTYEKSQDVVGKH